jgi:aspartate racemase
MIAETAVHLHIYHPRIKRVGVLSTTGTHLTRIYPQALAEFGLTAVVPDSEMQAVVVHTAVYHPHYGIKAQGTATPQARQNLETAVRSLQSNGAEAIILGCTEMPLAITEPTLYGLPVIDPTFILARALIREANPTKLKEIKS